MRPSSANFLAVPKILIWLVLLYTAVILNKISKFVKFLKYIIVRVAS